MADQLPAEVTESKAEVLPMAEAAKPAPVPAKEEKVAAAATAARAEAPDPGPRQGRRQEAARPKGCREDRHQGQAGKAGRRPQDQAGRQAGAKPVRAARKAVRRIETGVKTMANTTTQQGRRDRPDRRRAVPCRFRRHQRARQGRRREEREDRRRARRSDPRQCRGVRRLLEDRRQGRREHEPERRRI